MPTTSYAAKPATDKQIAFLAKLLKEAGATETVADFPTTKDASAKITELLDAKKAAKAPQAPQTTPAANAAFQAAIQTKPAATMDGSPSLVGKTIFIPYADSAAAYTIAEDNGIQVTLVKATIASPALKIADDWTHPLLGNGPVRIDKTPFIAETAKDLA